MVQLFGHEPGDLHLDKQKAAAEVHLNCNAGRFHCKFGATFDHRVHQLASISKMLNDIATETMC